jgi:hypothetical protein
MRTIFSIIMEDERRARIREETILQKIPALQAAREIPGIQSREDIKVNHNVTRSSKRCRDKTVEIPKHEEP